MSQPYPISSSSFTVHPYRSKNKNELSAFSYPKLNKQQNSKDYQLKTIGYFGEYIGDIMFSASAPDVLRTFSKQAKLAYLVMMEINTRYLFVEQLFDVVFDVDESTEFVNLKKSQKTTLNLIKAIQNIQNKIRSVNGHAIRILRFDGERAIHPLVKAKGKVITTPWGTYKQDFAIIQQSPATHSFTSLIDRAILTIRTLLFNINSDLSNPTAVEQVVNAYNNTKHQTLSKYLKDLKPDGVSPKDMIEDTILYQCFISQLKNYNYLVQMNSDLVLVNGAQVRVLSMALKEINKSFEKIRSKWSKQIFTIKSRKGNQYTLNELDGKYQFSRYQLLRV